VAPRPAALSATADELPAPQQPLERVASADAPGLQAAAPQQPQPVTSAAPQPAPKVAQTPGGSQPFEGFDGLGNAESAYSLAKVRCWVGLAECLCG
jgi:hypothetical protein